jgi:hypothetical protein
MKNILDFIYLSVFGLMIFSTGCKKDAAPASTTSSYPMQVKMTDDPSQYDAVLIDVQGIEVNTDDNGNDNGWTALPTKAGIYDLTHLRNGLDTVLATTNNLPAGKLSQIRLKLGPNNSVKIKGASYPLETPSAQQSGLKINVHSTLQPGILYTLLLDFDASRSIVEKGNGKFSLKPVIRAIAEATTGSVKGTVSPANSKPFIYALIGSDTAASTISDINGNFVIVGLSAGSYTLFFNPLSPFATQTLSTNVVLGQTTNVGTVTIH